MERKVRGEESNLSETDEKASSLLNRISELVKKHPTATGLVIVAIVIVVAGLTIYLYARSGKTQEAKK